MDERYARFSRLLIDRPHPRVLRVVMNRPEKLNAADGEMHADLTEIWRVIDTDASVNAVLLTGSHSSRWYLALAMPHRSGQMIAA